MHFAKEEKMTGESRWRCPNCKCKRDAVKSMAIWKLPPILLIHLKRLAILKTVGITSNLLFMQLDTHFELYVLIYQVHLIAENLTVCQRIDFFLNVEYFQTLSNQIRTVIFSLLNRLPSQRR